MVKVHKVSEVSSIACTPFGRDVLEEFPPDEPLIVDLPPALDEASEEKPEEADPQAIREAIFAEAKAEAEQMVQEAYAKGHALGMEAGRKEFEESIAESTRALDRAAQAMIAARQEFLDALEPQVVELATLVAARVLQREVRSDAELIHSTVRRALEQIADRQRLKVTVHPDDLEAFRTHKITLLEDFNGVEELDIEANASVSPGGCTVESGLMHVDARLETLLAKVLGALQE